MSESKKRSGVGKPTRSTAQKLRGVSSALRPTPSADDSGRTASASIYVMVTPGQKERYENAATARGMKLRELIVAALDEFVGEPMEGSTFERPGVVAGGIDVPWMMKSVTRLIERVDTFEQNAQRMLAGVIGNLVVHRAWDLGESLNVTDDPEWSSGRHIYLEEAHDEVAGMFPEPFRTNMFKAKEQLLAQLANTPPKPKLVY
jgi:hypothetical protein